MHPGEHCLAIPAQCRAQQSSGHHSDLTGASLASAWVQINPRPLYYSLAWNAGLSGCGRGFKVGLHQCLLDLAEREQHRCVWIALLALMPQTGTNIGTIKAEVADVPLPSHRCLPICTIACSNSRIRSAVFITVSS